MDLAVQPVVTNINSNQVFELGDLFINYLEQLGVEYVFGVPGGAIEPLYNALARSERRGGPQAIVARHEAGAAFMADGYSKQTGRLGVCCATTGPGATNLVTGVASASANAVPMLVITGQTALHTFGQGAFQDSSCANLDTVGLFKHCTRYSTLVSHPEQLEPKLITAIMKAFGPEPGPVHLSIPLDILRTPAPDGGGTHPNLRTLRRQSNLHDPEDVEALANALEKSDSPLFVLGAGSAGATESILAVAERINASVVATPHAKGLISPCHPRFRGILGYGGHHSAIDTLDPAHSDTIVCIGTLMSERAGNGWLKRIAATQQLIHIDNNESHFAQTTMACLHIKGCIARIFEQLLNPLGIRHLPSLDISGYTSDINFTLNDEPGCRSDDAPIKPQRLMRDLPRLFPPDTCYLVDSGAGLAWALHYLHASHRQRENWFRATVEFTSMGWAIGAAIGTALGKPGEPVVCITGDGSLLMSGQEMTVAVQEQLPVVFVVLNDSGLGMVKHGQRLTGAEPIGYAMPPVNFVQFAQSLGARGYCIESPNDLAVLDGKVPCNGDGPVLLDVRIDPEAVPPLANRINALVSRS